MNTDFDDFFELFTSLYNKLDSTSPDALTLFGDIKHMISLLQNTNHLNSDFFTIRTSDFNRQASSLEATTATDDTLSVNAAKYKLELSNSLSTILTYSDVDQETAKAFTNCVQAYKNLSDKNQTDAAATAIYHKATELFNLIYQKVFERSLELPGLSMPVKLFLYFGFVDEELAGDENCAYLSSLADSMEENKVSGIFTLYSWLQSIYQGEREPSRNQFEVDYKEYVHSLKVAQKITEAQERVMMADQFKKVGYELENMFPIVNKITHGQLSTFCPFFSSHRIIRPLNTCYVSPLVIKKVLEKISDLDYTAFYRETIYTNEALNIPREFIHVEYLPNFILMPNIGSRSVMWQEIEGRKRTTPARMMLSIFSLEDVESSILHLVGEYRWEICKRVQGPRWNDVTDRSLTSEYFDYVQYFRKNSELSADAKEKIKNALKKSKNSFREMFVRDYMTWVTFESAGSPRLNKIARGILFTYCPFRKEVRASLASNPLYKELSDKYEFKAKQHLHRYQLIEQKLKNSNTPLPSELKKEIKYIEG